MNEFALYHQLHTAKDLAAVYPQAEPLIRELEAAMEQLSTKQYRVAVIGEFKRGKSSLVNTLLGTRILPTDILPTTAVINRVIYDTRQNITIHYKDGSCQDTTIDQLEAYATKLDAEKEKRAETVREIVVHYPSVFCQNHIEIIDTPGLNDDDAMTQTTVGILDRIDTAIVVISAVMPLSVTEQQLICNLIRQSNIFHITFVITFIDRVSDEPEEQDRVIELLTRRIREDTYALFEKQCDGDEALLEKAASILKAPAVFAVSSKLAMDGFIRGKKSLLEESRFPKFKLELLALLTANQELDLKCRLKSILHRFREEFPCWASQTADALTKIRETAQAELDILTQCRSTRADALQQDFRQMEARLLGSGFSYESGDISHLLHTIAPEQHFIPHLSAIKKDAYREYSVRKALLQGLSQFHQQTHAVLLAWEKEIFAAMEEIEANISQRDKLCQIESTLQMNNRPAHLPPMVLKPQTLLAGIASLTGQVIAPVSYACRSALALAHRQYMEYILQWQDGLTQYEQDAMTRADAKAAEYEDRIRQDQEEKQHRQLAQTRITEFIGLLDTIRLD